MAGLTQHVAKVCGCGVWGQARRLPELVRNSEVKRLPARCPWRRWRRGRGDGWHTSDDGGRWQMAQGLRAAAGGRSAAAESGEGWRERQRGWCSRDGVSFDCKRNSRWPRRAGAAPWASVSHGQHPPPPHTYPQLLPSNQAPPPRPLTRVGPSTNPWGWPFAYGPVTPTPAQHTPTSPLPTPNTNTTAAAVACPDHSVSQAAPCGLPSYRPIVCPGTWWGRGGAVARGVARGGAWVLGHLLPY